jgi:uncharacterized protein (DUF58 family)
MTRKATGTLVVVATLMFAGLLLGRVELVALAAPLVSALLWGLAAAPDIDVTATGQLDVDRCIEGDEVMLTLTVSTTAPVAEALVGVILPAGLPLVEGERFSTVSLSPEESWTKRMALKPARWGAYRTGPVVVRAYGPGRYVAREQSFEIEGLLRVYPASEPLSRGLPPPRTQVFAGNYVSRAAAEGIEFAGVREYSATDDVKRINWRVTSRRGGLYINVHHPERNADVVLFLDTFGDVGPPGRTTLDLTVKGATALARHYLLRKDRVGLVNFGGTLGWITAGQGQSHTYRIVDYLLGVQATWSYAWKDLDFLPIGILPPLATVIAFSPLLDKRAVSALVNLQARGFPLVIIDTLAEDAVTPGHTAEERIAWRVWKMQRSAVAFDLERLGIPVVRWPREGSLEGALAALPAMRRRPRSRLA